MGKPTAERTDVPEAMDEGPWTDEDPDRELHYRIGEPLSVTLDDYQALARAH